MQELIIKYAVINCKKYVSYSPYPFLLCKKNVAACKYKQIFECNYNINVINYLPIYTRNQNKYLK